jgi:hypothetical protein
VFGKDHADSFLLLETGRADAFVMDGSILAANISKSKNPADYKIVGEVLSVEPIACMLRKDDPAFKKAVDDSIKRQIKSGSLAKLYDKWFMQPSRRPTPRSACRCLKPPRLPGPTPTTSPWKTTPRSKSGSPAPLRTVGLKGRFLLGFQAVAPTQYQITKGCPMSWDWQVFCQDTIDGKWCKAALAKAATSPTWTGCCRPGAGRCLWRCWRWRWRWWWAR